MHAVRHPFPPLYNGESETLILGTMPSVASRENGFYYGHKRNRFWPVLAALFDEALPASNEERRSLALRHNIALWDVLKSCEIKGSSDASIKNAEANDIASLASKTKIKRIFTNGKKAFELYTRLSADSVRLPAYILPSTSPANQRCSLEDLILSYRRAILCP